MKTISRYIMTLALLITAATGAWAEDTYTITFAANGNTVTKENVTLPKTFSCNFNNVTGRGTDELDLIIQELYGLSEGCCGTSAPNSDNASVTCNVDKANNQYIIVSAPFNGTATVTGRYADSNFMEFDYTLEISFPGYVAPFEVTTNKAEGETTFTEAWFNMPAYDATADYELVRDMSIQMTAQVGDGTQEQPRYRVKKDGNNKFIPADMEMAAVPALFTVNDAIEHKALTQTQDYIVQIYAINEQTGQPTGEPMTFATFTFEPGIYAVKAVAAQGSDYDGETALSNTFKLYQGYEVEVAAKEFITYYKDEPLYADTETSADAELYTIQSVSADQATLSAAIQTAPSLTPLLIFNNSDQAKTFLLIPANEEPNLALTVAPEFQGTLTATTIAASTDAQTNYALNGTAFVFVKNAIEIGANKAWLQISNGEPTARGITLVFGDATSIDHSTLNIDHSSDAVYDLSGRKVANGQSSMVNGQLNKGVYIMNGKKVVVK